MERRRFWAGAGGEVGANRWRGTQPGVRRRPPFFVQPGVRCCHRFPMRREAAVRGEPGLPHGRTCRARAGDEVHVVGDPTDGFSWRNTQRADTEVRAPAARDLEYGAVRRFSSLHRRCSGFTRAIQPKPALFVFFRGALFLCGGPLFSVHRSLPPQPKRWPHRTLNWPGVRCFHRFPMRREAAVRGEPGLPHGTTWRRPTGLRVTCRPVCPHGVVKQLTRKPGGLRHGRGPFALTPSLSHSHPGSAHRTSLRGRGGTRAAGPRTSRRSASPTDTRSVGSDSIAKVF